MSDTDGNKARSGNPEKESVVKVSLRTIAESCDGQLIGEPDVIVSHVASVQHAGPDDLAFLVDGRAVDAAIETNPGVLLLKPEDRALYSGNRILVADPYLAYARVSGLFARHQDADNNADSPSVHPSATVHQTARIDKGAVIDAGAFVGAGAHIATGVWVGCGAIVENDCMIGADTVIESLSVICSGAQVGKRCVISPGAVVGSSGFGYAPSREGWQKIHQLGGVVIGDDVDVGGNTTIDRGTIDDTIIGDRVKLDNHIQIAHNVQVGDDTIMAAFVGVAGSATIGKRCQFGGRSSIMGHIRICDDVVVHTNTFVARSIEEPGTFSSMLPAQPAAQWRKTVVLLNRIDKLAATIKKIGSKAKSQNKS